MGKINKNYLGLVRELAVTDFKLKYQGSFFGYLWSLVKPLMFFGVLYVVFTRFLKIGGTIPDYPVYLLLGIVLWSFFAETTAVSMSSIVSKGDLIRKVYFPRIILTISTSITSIITLILNLFVVLIFIIFSKVTPASNFYIFLLLLIEFFILTLGVSLILASLFVRFRDISHIWEVTLQVLFYGTPILYPLSLVPERFAKFLMLSPVAQIIQDSRRILITRETATVFEVLKSPYNLIPYILPFIIFVVGYYVFQKQSAKFAEEV
ncbi:MAG: ABC transporter permease [Candidatus Aenigmarchaeota archaeon]|nr:ABC transporter permease [Candidatus Aenigmarchaeota archaeon]